jgi:hypothetical protein
MGLDMYAYRTSVQISKPVDFQEEVYGDTIQGEKQDLHYWRKHPDLHGWMEKLYYQKGGQAESFNCSPVELTLDDLYILEADIKYAKLPETEGFFFGKSYGDESEDDLKFIKAARQAIEEGDRVFYDAWW